MGRIVPGSNSTLDRHVLTVFNCSIATVLNCPLSPIHQNDITVNLKNPSKKPLLLHSDMLNFSSATCCTYDSLRNSKFWIGRCNTRTRTFQKFIYYWLVRKWQFTILEYNHGQNKISTIQYVRSVVNICDLFWWPWNVRWDKESFFDVCPLQKMFSKIWRQPCLQEVTYFKPTSWPERMIHN